METTTNAEGKKLVSLNALANLLGYRSPLYLKFRLSVSKDLVAEPLKEGAVAKYFDAEAVEKFITDVVKAEIKDEPFITTKEAAKVLGVTPAEISTLRKDEAIPYYILKFGPDDDKPTILYRKSEIIAAFALSFQWNGGFYIKHERIKAYETVFSYILKIPYVQNVLLTEQEYYVLRILFQENKSKKWIEEELHLCKERVRQIYESSIRKVCSWFTDPSSHLNEGQKEASDLELTNKLLTDEVNELRETVVKLYSVINAIPSSPLQEYKNVVDKLVAESQYRKTAMEKIMELSKTGSTNENKLIKELTNAAEILNTFLTSDTTINSLQLSSTVVKKLEERKEELLTTDITAINRPFPLTFHIGKRLQSLGYGTLKELLKVKDPDLRANKFRATSIRKIHHWIRSLGFQPGTEFIPQNKAV